MRDKTTTYNSPNLCEAIEAGARHAWAQMCKTNGPYTLAQYASKEIMNNNTEHARLVIEGFMAHMARYDIIPRQVKVTENLDMVIGMNDLNLIRQWFEHGQDLGHPDYMKKADYKLAERIYKILGWKVPNSVSTKVKK